MPGKIDMAELADVLWHDGGDAAFAVLDGAGIPNLLDRLYAHPQPEFACLFRGELPADVAEVAPYLVRLERDSEMLQWIVSAWGKAWGIFVVAPDTLDLAAVRRHLRKLNLVSGADGSTLMFRYYDPRVMRTFLPLSEPQQRLDVFGPLRRIVVEAEQPDLCQVFALTNDGALAERQVNLAA
jgi:hypothetical protein